MALRYQQAQDTLTRLSKCTNCGSDHVNVLPVLRYMGLNRDGAKTGWFYIHCETCGQEYDN